MSDQTRDICCIINQARASGRGLLQGILRFAESRPDWRMHLYEPDAHGFSETIRALQVGSTDGVLTAELEDQSFATRLAQDGPDDWRMAEASVTVRLATGFRSLRA